MNTDKLSLLLSTPDFPSYDQELTQILEEMIDLSVKSSPEAEESEMAILKSFFDSISTIQSEIEKEKKSLQDKIDEASSKLFSQNESVNSLFNDIIPSMEYPFLLPSGLYLNCSEQYSKATSEYSLKEELYEQLDTTVQLYNTSLVKQQVAIESSFFLSETEDLKKAIELLDITDEDATASIQDSILLLQSKFTQSFIHQYLSERTELHTCISKRIQYLIHQLRQTYTSYLTSLLEKNNYPSTSSNHEIFAVEADAYQILQEAFARYRDYEQDMKEDAVISDLVDILLHPVQIRFQFHFIYSETTNMNASAAVYMHYIQSFLSANLPFLLRFLSDLDPAQTLERLLQTVCQSTVKILEERVLFDLECIFANPAESVMVLQNLLNEVMDFDDYLCSTWGFDLQETPFLGSAIQESSYFTNWLAIDKQVYSSVIRSSYTEDNWMMLMNLLCKKIDHLFGMSKKSQYCTDVVFPLLTMYCFVKDRTLPVTPDLQIHWTPIVEMHSSLQQIHSVLRLFHDRVVDVYYPDAEQNDCVTQFERFEATWKAKKQDLINALLLRAFQFLCGILDTCIHTQLYTLPEDETFPAKVVEQAITHGYERLEAFHSEATVHFEKVFIRGLFTKLMSKLDSEIKERVTRIHYNQLGKTRLRSTLQQLMKLLEIEKMVPPSTFKFTADIHNLLLLSEKQITSLTKCLDDGEEHDDAYYSQYLNTVKIEKLGRDDVMCIVRNNESF